MKKEIIDLVTSKFKKIGFDVIYVPKNKQTHGPDLWVKTKTSRPMTVEILKCRKTKNGTESLVDRVYDARKKDDFVAIVLNENYVLIESMADQLKCCNKSGNRFFTIFYK